MPSRQRPPGDPALRGPADAGGGLRHHQRQHLRFRGDEDLGGDRRVPRAATSSIPTIRACSRAGRSCSRGPRTITTGSTTPRSTSTRTASCSSAIAARSAIPGAAEVVNMRPPTKLIEKGIKALPTIGDGRQSGTSESPSILNASPEAAIGGNLAIVRTGDTRAARPAQPPARPADPARGDRAAPGRAEAASAQDPAEPDALAGDLPQHGGPALDRRLPRARGAVPEDRRDLRHARGATTERPCAARHRRPGPGPARRAGAGRGCRPRNGSGSARPGVASANAGDLAAAERSFREALALAEQLPPRRPAPGDQRQQSGLRAARAGAHRARPCPTTPRRLSLRDATLGPTHPVTAQSLNNLAEALRTDGQRDEAEQLHRRAIEIRRTRLGARPSRSRREPEQSGRAADRRAAGSTRREALFAEALAIRIKALGEQHSAVAEVQGNLGALAFARGRLRRGRAAPARGAGDRGGRRTAPASRAIAFALGNLAQVLMAEGKARGGGGTARARAGDAAGRASAPTGWRRHRAGTRWRWR